MGPPLWCLGDPLFSPSGGQWDPPTGGHWVTPSLTREKGGSPGSGLSHTKTVGGSRSSPSAGQRAPAPSTGAQPVKPGGLAPRWEKNLYKALTTGRFDELATIGTANPDVAGLVAALDGLTALQAGDNPRALALLRWAWATAGTVETHPFVAKYVSSSTVNITVAAGATATLPISRDAVGLALAELEQDAGNLDAAIAVVEALEPSAIAAVSVAELYLDAGRHQDVVDLTNGVTNDDDPTALLMTFRGMALRELSHHTAAREAFKEALKSKSRHKVIRQRALIERARSYLQEDKRAMARKDLERVLSEDSSFPGLQELIGEL